MKFIRILGAVLAGLLAGSSALADVKISDLPAGTTLAGTESVPAVQSGATVKTTPSAIATYVRSTSAGAGLLSGTSGGVPFWSSSSTLGSSDTLAAQCLVIGGGVGSAPTTDADLTWDSTTNLLTLGSTTNAATIRGATGTTTGVALTIAGGPAGATQVGGTLTLRGGAGGTASGNGGTLSLIGGIPSEGIGGSVNISAASGVTAGSINRAGGSVTVTGGSGVVAGNGGSLTFNAGGAGPTGTSGGSVNFTAGAGGSTSGNTGSISFTNATPVDGDSGSITLTSKSGVGTNRNGGTVTLDAGTPTGSATAGGTTFKIAGVQKARIENDGGLTIGAPTGGTQGTGTINATGLFVNGVAAHSGTLAFGLGGTGLTSAADDTTLVSSGSAWIASALPDCGSSTQALAYSTSTNAFSCQTVTGSGGTPGGSTTQVQFNDAGAFAGDADFLWGKTTKILTLGSTTTAATVQAADRATSGAGVALTVKGGAGNTSGTGGSLNLIAGAGAVAGQGGGANLTGGAGGATSGNGGDVILTGGAASTTTGNGGGVSLSGRSGVGSGKNGGGISFNSGAASDSTGTSGSIQFQSWQSDTSFDLQTPSSGFSITLADRKGVLILDPAGTLATGTITMPLKPNNGQIVRVSSSQIVTSLTVSPNTSQSIKNAPTTIVAGGSFAYIFVTSGTTWYKIQ